MFEEFEFDPMAAGMGIVGGILSIVVMGGVQIGILIKGLSFILTTIACYFVFSFIKNRG